MDINFVKISLNTIWVGILKMVSRKLIAAILVAAIVVLVVISIVWYLYYCQPHAMLKYWSRHARDQIYIQDSLPPSGIPGVFSPRHIRNPSIRNFNNRIILERQTLLHEAVSFINKNKTLGKPLHPYDGKGDRNDWRKIWVKYADTWSVSSNDLPSLRKLGSKFKDISSIWIDVLPHLGVATPNKLDNQLSQTYTFGLSVPPGDAGFVVADKYKLRWINKEGIVWDPSWNHASWNRTGHPCILISVTFRRDLDWYHNLGTGAIYNMIQYSHYVKNNPDLSGDSCIPI